MYATQETFHISGAKVAPLKLGKDALDPSKSKNTLASLKKLGLNFDKMLTSSAMKAYAGDSLQPLNNTVASVTTPVQFLQFWLPGFVNTVTAARNIDLLVGITTAGDWEDEEVVQGVMETTGNAVPYGDYSNIPLASWNANFKRFTIVRLELGLQVTNLEQKRAAKMRVDAGGQKRTSVANELEIVRNQIGFYGYNSGLNRTYGFLNAPGLPAYVPVAENTASQTQWQYKSFLEVEADLLTMFASLQTQTQDTINPQKVSTVLAVATAAVVYLAKTSDFGISVMQWLKATYPLCRVESAPELNNATASTNVCYLYAEMVSGDGSTDDGKVFMQIVPTKFMTLGVQPEVKGFKEDYSNATAGVICKRPYAVYRASGI